MRGFSSQWLLNIIAWHHYTTVISDFIRRECVCAIRTQARKIWNNKKSGMLRVYDACLPYRISARWILSIVLKMGNNRKRRNRVLREGILLGTVCAGHVHATLAAPTATHIHLLPASYIFLTAWHCTVCLLQQSILSCTDMLWETMPLQDGWKMNLMFHLCLTSSFSRAAFVLQV